MNRVPTVSARGVLPSGWNQNRPFAGGVSAELIGIWF